MSLCFVNFSIFLHSFIVICKFLSSALVSGVKLSCNFWHTLYAAGIACEYMMLYFMCLFMFYVY